MTNELFLEKIKALNEPTRLTIIKMLSKNDRMCACKILDTLNISQGTLSHHMKVLSKAKLISTQKNGKWCNYSLIKENFIELGEFLNQLSK